MLSQETYTLRRPTHDDAQAIVDLCNAGDIAATGQPQTDMAQLLDQWNAPYFEMTRDAWLAHTAAGQVVGYLECSFEPGEDEVTLFFNLHPDHTTTGLDVLLLKTGEQHAAALAARANPEPRDILTAFYANETDSRRLVEARGYQVVRYFCRMETAFEAPPPPVPDVPGVCIRSYDPVQDEVALYEALEDSFEDHWRHKRATLDEWRAAKIHSEGYDPAAWVVAEVDGVIVGGAVCTRYAGVPWVRMLGVRRAWRQRGIARAVLLAVFNHFYVMGDRCVGLTVDAASPTNATRLYESAGMRVTDERVVYSRPLHLTPSPNTEPT